MVFKNGVRNIKAIIHNGSLMVDYLPWKWVKDVPKLSKCPWLP